jgi:spermidine/putrescine transport system ATP-binding protein
LTAAPVTMVELRQVTKRFGSFIAVDYVSLDVRAGEFLTLLGPSGCGKTTILRMISGFEQPTTGRVLLEGQDVTELPPYRRDVNQVFQSYALFPHLNVLDNVCFGLRMKKVPRDEMRRRAARAVELVSLQGFERRKPHQLSGGQRQRVALARAIVNEPKVLLLDEPLSALDAKLRREMQIELKRLQKQLGITFVFVTHDQEEALTMSDRIAVVNHGRIEQLGDAAEIYHRPRTAFAANFIGQANVFDASVVSREDQTARVSMNGKLELTVLAASVPPGVTNVLLSIRPEKASLQKRQPTSDTTNCFVAHVTEEIFMGATNQLALQTDSGLALTVVVANEGASREAFHQGDRVWVQLHPEDVVVIPV